MGQKNHFELMVAGLGGQGALFIGRLLAEAALSKYKNATFFPNYGMAVRLGPSECTVTISDNEITSPMTMTPEALIIMGAAPLASFEGRIAPGSMMILDSSLVQTKSERKDVKIFYIPATKAATDLGNMAVTNLVLLGAYLEASQVVPLETVEATLERRMAGGRREAMLDLNKAALREGAKLMAEYQVEQKASPN